MNDGLSSLIFLGLLIAVFYLMVMRPQRKRVEQHRRLVDSVGVGDEIVTIGGLFGTVTSVGDEEIELDAGGTRLRFLKSAIARRVTEDLSEEASSSEEQGA